jgi:hypothetical protein
MRRHRCCRRRIEASWLAEGRTRVFDISFGKGGGRRLLALLGDPDAGRAQRAVQAMLTMERIDIAAIERAAEGLPWPGHDPFATSGDGDFP